MYVNQFSSDRHQLPNNVIITIIIVTQPTSQLVNHIVLIDFILPHVHKWRQHTNLLCLCSSSSSSSSSSTDDLNLLVVYISWMRMIMFRWMQLHTRPSSFSIGLGPPSAHRRRRLTRREDEGNGQALYKWKVHWIYYASLLDFMVRFRIMHRNLVSRAPRVRSSFAFGKSTVAMVAVVAMRWRDGGTFGG